MPPWRLLGASWVSPTSLLVAAWGPLGASWVAPCGLVAWVLPRCPLGVSLVSLIQTQLQIQIQNWSHGQVLTEVQVQISGSDL